MTMKIPYKRTRQLSTAELPGVICEPNLTFIFSANPSFEIMKDLSLWQQEPTWDETRRLAAEIIIGVIIPDGNRYELGTVDTIEMLAEETETEFIGNILNGWYTRLSLERLGELKKSRISSEPLPIINGKIAQA